MSVVTSQDEIVYEDSDGRRIADNTLQFEWIVTWMQGGLARLDGDLDQAEELVNRSLEIGDTTAHRHGPAHGHLRRA